MNILYYGTSGPQVQLLQLALTRAGFDPGGTDGVFGQNTLRALRLFQSSRGLTADGVAGRLTHEALLPWYTGNLRRTLRPGDSFYRLAQTYGTTVLAISAANPDLNPLRLSVGMPITIPLNFDIVPTDIAWCSELVRFCCEGLSRRYPFIRSGSIGSSVLGRPLWQLRLGTGERRVLHQAVHHANEWICAPLLLRFAEVLAKAETRDAPVLGYSAREILENASLSMLPCVNPDGMDLVTGALKSGAAYENAAAIGRNYAFIPFPDGWKANLQGIDLNLQYPAGWENAREIKFAEGFTSPAPRDYVGTSALSAPEARAVYEHTLSYSPHLTLSYHTQGEVIYWKYLNFNPPGAEALAQQFAAVSGYAPEETPYASGFAGYKDWFIQNFNRPGYTIEAGSGENPLPLSAFPGIFDKNLGILMRSLAA